MEDELKLNIGSLFNLLFKNKWWILLITGLFAIGGIIYALTAREEFESRGRILPEIQGKGAGGIGQFSGLASLAGIDLSSFGNSSIDAVRPDLYPDVITSTPFYLELLKIKVHTKDNKEVTFEHYYHTVMEDGKEIKGKLIRKYPVKEDGIIVVNRLSEIRLKDLKSRIGAIIDKKSGIITISSKMPDPVVAAEVSLFAMEYLVNYVKLYRTEKLRQDVNYLSDQLATSRGKFYKTQEMKARYSDQFQDMVLQSADVRRERIESEYKISSTFYNELLKKYEEAKFKLHQETPVFKILEPPVAPVKKSEPKRIIIVFLSIIVGGILSFTVVLLKGKNYRKVFN